MGTPYSSTAVSGYNANPPPDDGTAVATNKITWSGIKSKLSDPLNTFASAVNSALVTAFGKTIDGASVVSTAGAYPVGAADQGRLIKCTAALTVTTPDATSVGTPFVFRVLNNTSSSSVTLAGFGGTQTIDGLTTQNLAPGAGVILSTDGTNWFSGGLTPAQITNPGKPQGYLTLSSSTSAVVPVADIVASTNVYYTPYVGNVIPIYNGTLFVSNTFSQLILALVANHLANTLYDVFVFLNAGVVTIGTGPAWSTSTAGAGARGVGAGTTELQTLNGIWTNKNSMTTRNGATTYTVAANQGTYVGSIYIDAVAGQCTSHVTYGQNRKWGTWNAYNRIRIFLQCGDSTASWNYKVATWRPANNATANSITVFTGLPEEQMELQYEDWGSAICSSSEVLGNNGIGWNVTNALSGTNGVLGCNAAASAVTVNGNLVAQYFPVPTIGINTVTAIEQGDAGGGTFTWHGTQANMILSARYKG